MPTYLVESYGANYGNALTDAQERAARAADVGAGVRYVRTTFLPGDEMALHVFEAASEDAVRRAVGLAALHYERIVEAIEARDDRTERRETHPAPAMRSPEREEEA